MLKVLKLPFELTMGIQYSSYTLSDFYGGWLKMTRRLEQLVQQQDGSNDFALTLLEHTRKREPSLLNNSAMLAAVYLDPRYSFKLTAEEKKIAKFSLEKLLERVHQAKAQLTQSKQAAVTEQQNNDSFEDDCVKSGLRRTFYGETGNSASPADVGNNDLFTAYDEIARIHHKNSILQFWEDHSIQHPVLYELARIVLAIPPSQTTVERAFSVLGYIYNCRRTQLKPKRLEDILTIILNRDLVEPIHQRDMHALS